MKLSVSISVLLILFSSCNDKTKFCTLVDCLDGLELILEWNEEDTVAIVNSFPITIIATSNTGEQRLTFCDIDDCPALFEFEGWHPEEVTIVLININNDSLIVNEIPEYVFLEPNGPGCPPTCNYARITSQLLF